ncbi:MAG: putative spermidine/putrescine transport system ATP-binding protein/spermidine/putrescine transport system ATP-binding protein [Candidatus Kentron sp. G]|nr:MAG: putative spermidine/putrescine transport system ATP-binding protein/spermidine/putrescine transport system ATP-binding protein [Candidatus Kentron sp. G]VFN07993.1 MAG: putative spermidine/putrescine transport system ATP-binding protein/spermidine/putrescine transport system ATP-binding protein [Candidatus Kentron sp. G]
MALARSLVVEPRILLLDEPYTGLDQMLRNSLQRDLKRLMEERNRTYVLVSHDFDNVLALADRVAVMRTGKIVQLGAPSDILENPKSSFIVNLLGWSNLISGSVVEMQDDNHRVRVQTGSGAWWGRNPDRENFSPRRDQDVFYVVHPQDILLDDGVTSSPLSYFSLALIPG